MRRPKDLLPFQPNQWGSGTMQRIVTVVLVVFLGLQLSACAHISGETLKIDARHAPGTQHVPDELTQMLRDLGYDWIHIHDPETGRGVKIVQIDGEYRMRFEFLETRTVRIDVRVRRVDGVAWLHLYRIDRQPLGTASSHLFQELKARAEQEFGAANISH